MGLTKPVICEIGYKTWLINELGCNNMYVYDAPIVESQFIRKLIAKKIGAEERFLWNSNPNLEWMVEIIHDLTGVFN